MADLPIKDLGNKQVQTERKPITLDKPQETQKEVQVHRGNIDLLSLKFLESINVVLHKIYQLMLENKK